MKDAYYINNLIGTKDPQFKKALKPEEVEETGVLDKNQKDILKKDFKLKLDNHINDLPYEGEKSSKSLKVEDIYSSIDEDDLLDSIELDDSFSAFTEFDEDIYFDDYQDLMDEVYSDDLLDDDLMDLYMENPTQAGGHPSSPDEDEMDMQAMSRNVSQIGSGLSKLGGAPSRKWWYSKAKNDRLRREYFDRQRKDIVMGAAGLAHKKMGLDEHSAKLIANQADSLLAPAARWGIRKVQAEMAKKKKK